MIDITHAMSDPFDLSPQDATHKVESKIRRLQAFNLLLLCLHDVGLSERDTLLSWGLDLCIASRRTYEGSITRFCG